MQYKNNLLNGNVLEMITIEKSFFFCLKKKWNRNTSEYVLRKIHSLPNNRYFLSLVSIWHCVKRNVVPQFFAKNRIWLKSISFLYACFKLFPRIRISWAGLKKVLKGFFMIYDFVAQKLNLLNWFRNKGPHYLIYFLKQFFIIANNQPCYFINF